MHGVDVVVVGSANVDLVLPVERIPRPGETVLARELSRGPGGKGANQAVAAVRAGAGTALVARLGDDDSGALLRDALAAAGVGLDLVGRTSTPTGTAIITVDPTGENAITVAPSANAELTLDQAATAAVAAAPVVLLQLEIPFDTVAAAARAGRFVILNAAPAAKVGAGILAEVDLLVVNEHEAAVLGDAMGQVPAVVITLGAAGARVLRRGEEPVHVPGITVPVVDTTAAGDTFCGVLAASLATGTELLAAVRRANAAASLSVQHLGAIASIPAAAAIQARYAEVYR